MPPTTTADTDPVAIVEALDADAIRRQMSDLDERRRALSALLRVAIVRERAQRRRQTTAPAGEPHHAR